MNAPRLLLVDDEPNVLKALARQLRAVDRGGDPSYLIESFICPSEALSRASQHAFDLVISDYRMPGMDGVAFLAQLRAVQPYAARLLLSGQADLSALLGAINRAGVVRFLCKPWEHTELILAVETSLLERGLLLENQRLANEIRVQRGIISRQEAELRRLEIQCPGITRIATGEDAAVQVEVDALGDAAE